MGLCMKNVPDKKSLLFLNIAVMLFGLSGVIAKFISASPVAITFGRALLSSFLLFCTVLIKREGFKLKLIKDLLFLVLSGVLLAAHWTAFFQSIKTASVAIGTITFSTFPLFLAILEPLFFHEQLRGRSLIYAAVLICGVLITVPEFSYSNQTTLGILWGMAGSLTYALIVLLNRDLSGRYSGAKICMYEQAVAAVVLLPAVFLARERLGAEDIAGIAAIGALCTALGFSLFVTAQKKVSAQTAGIVSGMETVYGILFAFLFLGAAPSVREIVGGTIILGVAAVSSRKQGGIL
jgi:drug/metabolite transporter (DMT)-like permease